MSLTNEQKKRYRSIGHNLKPIVTVAGNGLTDNVITEVERALSDHELVKIKLAIADRELRKQAASLLSEKTGALILQSIGKTLLIFKAAKKPNPRLSNLLR